MRTCVRDFLSNSFLSLVVVVATTGWLLGGCGSDAATSGRQGGTTQTVGGTAGASAGTSAGDGSSQPGGARGETNGSGGMVASAGAAGAVTKASLPPNNARTCETPSDAVSLQHIEAECAFGASTGSCQGTSGGQLGTETENDGTTVGYIEEGDQLWYSGVVMDGITTLTLRYAKGVDGGSVEVRLDSATGTRLGTISPSTTGDWNTWAEATVSLSAATGTHDLYLVMTGSTSGILSLDWLELSAGEAAATGGASAFHMNQLGFDTLGPKHAVIEGPAGLKSFSVVGNDNQAVWCGELVPEAFTAWGSSLSFYSVDFTELTLAGTYRLQVGSAASSSFEISDQRHFLETVPSVVSYFKLSRADDADVVAADSSAELVGTSERKDVHGGWYDASGDISKYLSHLSYANYLNPQQIPLVVWALAYSYEEGGSALSASGQATAMQAEALYGADYLLRVLDPAGFFYMDVFDQWTGDLGNRRICAFEGQTGTPTADYQSALREGGGMSIAALARAAGLQVNGEYTSAQYLEGAERAFTHLNTNGVGYADDQKENIIDDYTGLLAASELYAVTKTATYLDAARARATSLVGRLSDEGYFIADGASRPFWHASDAGLPVVSLSRYVQVETDQARKVKAKEAIFTHLSYLVEVTRAVANPYGYARQHIAAGKAGFFIPHVNESGYWWQGENARLASLAAAALIGAEVLAATGTEYLDLLRYAGYQLDWILGANPYDICFMKGVGTSNPEGYSGEKPQNGTWPGGIVNGVTGSGDDGSGIAWMGASADAPWDNWRWNEQWLPHSAWYLVAATALSRQ
jgi:hypothetical protein